MLIRAPADLSVRDGLELAEIDRPTAGAGEILVRVCVCGVCRTDLDLLEGRLVPPQYPVVPGHQVAGRVAAVGRGVTEFREGDRVGVAWIHWADGECSWCRSGNENLCPRFRATGCDANGGYADFLTVPAPFAFELPREMSDAMVAPLLCAGAIGWRALRHADLRHEDALGLTGFGSSAHLVLQLAKYRYPESPVYVFARNALEREFAHELGAAWVGDTEDRAPTPMGAIIDTTPAWKPVVAALRQLMPGGRLVINAIRKSNDDRSELATIDYSTDLWMERSITSVANVTRDDVREMLAAAADAGIHPTVSEVALAEANGVLRRMSKGASVRGATVLRVRGERAHDGD